MQKESRAVAAEILPGIEAAHERLTTWRQEHRNIADYRIEDTHHALTSALHELRKLVTGEDPRLAAALETFRSLG